MKCTQRLYLTADRKKLVAEGDKKAATLYAVPGDEIPQSAHDRFGLVDGHLKGFDPDALETPKKTETEPAPTTIAATQALYHSSAQPDSLVGEGHQEAGKLYANVGDQIPVAAHKGFGLVDGHLPDFDPNAGSGSDNKEQKDAPDKEQKGAPDKEQKPAGENSQSGGGQASADGDKA